MDISTGQFQGLRFTSIMLSAGIAVLLLFSVAELLTVTAECQRTAAAMVIEHLRRHQDTWPRSWEDLRDDYDVVARRRCFRHSFATLQSRVGIVWEADVESLRNTARGNDWEPPFQVIWALNGASILEMWDGKEPNQMIWNYLHGELDRTAEDPHTVGPR